VGYFQLAGTAKTLSGFSTTAGSLNFTPDGKSLRYRVVDGTIKLWDVASGKELQSLPQDGHNNASFAFSPDKNPGRRNIRWADQAVGFINA